jgi:hypothetical protein
MAIAVLEVVVVAVAFAESAFRDILFAPLLRSSTGTDYPADSIVLASSNNMRWVDSGPNSCPCSRLAQSNRPRLRQGTLFSSGKISLIGSSATSCGKHVKFLPAQGMLAAAHTLPAEQILKSSQSLSSIQATNLRTFWEWFS